MNMRNPAFQRLVMLLLGAAFLAFGFTLGIKVVRNGLPTDKAHFQETGVSALGSPATHGPHSVAATPTARQLPVSAPSMQSANTKPLSGALPAEPTPYTRRLVADMTGLNVSEGSISKEQAEQWKRNLQKLTEQGAAAVPAIREFLEKNHELNFTNITGADLLGQPSLRAAMINALADINGPEATAAMVDTLGSAALPSELVQLAAALDQRAPGQYRQETLNAFAEIVKMASNGQLPPDWDLAPVFKLVQGYGDFPAASALEQAQGAFTYYAIMSLATMEGSDGATVLARQAQDPSAGEQQRDFALQLLAQMAPENPNATGALAAQARANQIPDTAWTKIADGLAGDQYHIGNGPSPTPGNDPGGDPPGLKTYHLVTGNQSFYALPLPPGSPLQDRLAVIDQLLEAASSNAAAQAALQSARASLTQVAAN